MISSILRFLEASPGRLLDDLSSSSSDGSFFKPFLFCCLSPDATVRRLAISVAERLFAGHEHTFRAFDKARFLGTYEQRRELGGQR